MYDRIKAFLEDDAIFYTLLLLLIGTTSFGLGRWSMAENMPTEGVSSIQMVQNKASVRENVTSADESAAKSEGDSTALQGAYVASKKGTKYHSPWCPGAKQMKEDNKIWFATKAEAEAAGYSPAANCKGL